MASSPALAVAQTVTDPAAVSANAEQEVIIKEDLFSVAPMLETELSADNAVPVELQFTSTPNTTEAVDVTGVSAEGFTRKVMVGGDEIAQVVVTRLKKDTNYVDLAADRFTSQFGVDSDRLTPTTAISVNGDEAEFVRAIAQLTDQEPAEEEEQEAEADKTVEDDTSVDEDGKSGGENPIAGGYETPDRLAMDEEEEREPNVSYRVTSEGCEHDVDLISGVVRQQSLSQTLEDGVVTATEACSPNGTVWPIQKSFEACEDIVDLDDMVAKPQFTSFYTDDKDARYEVSGCQVDDAEFYAINEDFEACAPDLNLDGETVTFLSQLTYRGRGGKNVTVAECAPSDKTFEMARDYNVCSDLVDLEKGAANAQYSLFYVDGKASRHTVSDCLPDEEMAFPIVEKENCTFDFDLVNGKAIVNTSLVYTTDRNVEVSVRECGPSETIEPIQMTADVSNCSLRHDFANGLSTEMAMWTYEYEGQLYQATPCITTENTYTHSRVFERSGIDVCPPIVDLANGQAARQYRTEITRDGVHEVVAACQPDENNMMSVQSTEFGCEDPSSFDHDLIAGVSYGRERFYYDAPGQGRVYVTSCQESDRVYTHSVEPAGWKYNDPGLRAQRLVDVSINVNGKGYVVASSYLQPGTSEVAYSHLEDRDEPNFDQRYYEGCIELVPTSRAHVYTRPDGTTYAHIVGEGDLFNNGDKCERTVEERVRSGVKINLAVKGYVARVRDGSGNIHSVRNGCNTGGKTLEGNPPYQVLSQNGPQSGCRNPSNKVSIYSAHDERTKTVTPAGEVTYSNWKLVRWSS
ncbi:hypothetical protein FMN50_01860 [Rhodobacterales bacterium]|nr:hypothetical protein FMN50_01860 [Rhodobacterales bacterium]